MKSGLTHTRKRADGSSGNRGVKEYFNSSENDQKRPENDIFRIFLLFVISRSGVRVRLPAPIFPQRSKVNMGEFPSGRFYLVLVLFCHVRGFLHSAGAKGLNDMTGGVFCIIGNSSVLSRAERHIGRSLRFRWEGHVFNRGILRVDVDHMGRLYGFTYWFCNISRPPLPHRSGLRPAASRSGKPSPVGGLGYVFWTLFFSHCHRIRKPMPAAIQEEI